MKFAVAKEHRDFFRKHHRIEFDGLLSKEQCQKLLDAKNAIVSERLHTSSANLKLMLGDDLLMAGYDLWRGNAAAKRIILQKPFAEIASELIELKPLRIGYDQFIPSFSSLGSIISNRYRDWLFQATTLEEMSAMQGVLCGLMLCLSEPKKENVETPAEKTPGLFSTKAGNGIFFAPQLPLDFKELSKLQGFTYLMVVYVKGVSVYVKMEADPHTNEFRQLGYNFGDRLSDRHHPLVYV